jgi:phosphopantetheine adenylyltransferase
MKYAVEMASIAVIFTGSFMTIGLGFLVILTLLLQQFERLCVGITDGRDL